MSAQSPDSPPPDLPSLAYASKPPEHLYRVGTLVYTRRALFLVFFWMLWGDFCFTLIQAVVPNLLPLTLNDLGAQNALIGLLLGTLPGGMNMLIGPVVSFKSDRYRSRLGRRIPFLLFPAPLVAVFLILTGYAVPIGEWLQRSVLTGVPTNTVIIGAIAVFCVLFQFFNLFSNFVYYYLFNDVIPEQFMGRFYGLFKVVGAGAAFIFNRFLLGWADTHRSDIYVAIAIVYFVAFSLMCWRVREGEYPPPPIDAQRAGFLGNIAIFARECFSHPYYRWFYAGNAFYMVGNVAVQTFVILLATRELKLSAETYGKVASWPWVMQLVVSMPLGWAADRMHPLRLQLIAMAVMPLVGLGCFMGIRTENTLLLWVNLWWLGHTVWLMANAPLFPVLLPADRYGQFCSAQSILTSLGMMVASVGGGKFIDVMGSYRYLYLWYSVFAFLGFLCTLKVYQGWKRLGGRHHYKAPTPWAEQPAPVSAFPVLTEEVTTRSSR